ncbi:hypothetical protein KL864_34605 [Mycolicibacterium goodii]|uniref:RAMP superfamily CRISPR-associated protein n=1 Tax=Mycolicibacterium goodii TaxID=134601 RepID=UPI001BDBC616|nr:RAMP superfamily CRISPR-associated protein [Mycolicibacterium goodii]MBU8820994.1 hypothetical protein [Mycolicibacterium goodii]
MSLNTIRWVIDIVAMSSIVHRGSDNDSVGTDTTAAFRTEKTVRDGEVLFVPIVSGSSFRGVLRRIGEDLTAEVLDYEDAALPVPAAHLLTNGGRVAKSARPFTDEDERHLKALIPQIAVFGGAASSRIMSSLLTVGKVVPELEETLHMLTRPPRATPLSSVFILAEESFSHLSDHRPTTAAPPRTDSGESTSPLGRFAVETLPAGTAFQTSVRIANATIDQVAFMHEVLSVFATRGHLGGRIASGHGSVRATFSDIEVERGQRPDSTHEVDWRAKLKARRDEAIAALSKLT